MRLIRKLAMAIILVSLLAMLFPLSVAQADDAVNFPDPNLQAAIRERINKPDGDIYQSDLVGIVTLNASSRSIVDLTGMEHCINLTQVHFDANQISNLSALTGLTNLTHLYLNDNQISDISPLAELTNLTWLELSGNPISDLSALAGLTNLRFLYLYDNPISDLSPLAGLTNLRGLYLGTNQVSDVSALAGLTNLAYLSLDNNQVSDLSALAGLTNLREIYFRTNQISDLSALAGLTNLAWMELSGNQISDIEPLVNNPGLSTGDYINLTSNPLSPISITTYIPQLQARGVTVEYDAPTPTPTPAPISCTQFSSHPGNSAQVSISGASVSQSTATYGDTVNIHVQIQYVGPVTPILGFPTLMIHKPNGTVLAEWNMDEQGGINPGFPAFPVPFCISQGNIFVFDVSWDLKDIYGYWVPPAQYNIQAGIMIPEQNNQETYWVLSSIGGEQPGPVSVIGTQLPNTLAGQNVTVPFYVQSTPPHPMAVVTFSEVTGDGTTAIELSGANPVGPTPSGFYPVGPFVRVTTTATYTGPVAVGIGLPPPPVPPVTPDMKMFHWDGTSWKDVTTNVDAVNRIVYGQDESLDWWFVGYTMATVPTATRTGIVGFSSSSGTIESLTAISESSLPAEGKPSLLFPHGLFSFDITGLSGGETVEVTIELPSNVPTNAQYWKWDSTLGWYQIDFGDNDGDNIITIQLTDNGTGDSDPTPGRIHDDGGPGNPPQQPGGGGVGVPVFPSVYIGIAAALGAGVLAYFVRRRLIQQG